MGVFQRLLLAAAASLAIATSSIGSVAPAIAVPITTATIEQATEPTDSPTGTVVPTTESPATTQPTEATSPTETSQPSANATAASTEVTAPVSSEALPVPTQAQLQLEAVAGGATTAGSLLSQGSYTTSGAIGAKYATSSGGLGAATSQEFTNQRFGGAYQLFENGTIAYLPQSGAYMVIRGINNVWQSIGAQDSDLGYPTSDEYANEYALTAGGVTQNFQFGKISWTFFDGSRITKGGIGSTWDNAGGPLSDLGYPTTDEYAPMPGGVMQGFEYGKISWNAATGSRITKGGIGATWDSGGGPLSGLGYPTTNEIAGLTGGGAKQYFQYGEVVWSPSAGTRIITGGIRSAWVGQRSEAGRLGYPTTNEYGVSGGSAQDFQGGRIIWYPGNTKIEYASDA